MRSFPKEAGRLYKQAPLRGASPEGDKQREEAKARFEQYRKLAGL
jgi:hypothetical protein